MREGKTAFVGGALPGELVRFRRIRRHRSHDEGQLLEVLEPCADRVTPRCPHFGVCGGCALQHLAAGRQIEIKQLELRDALERVARVTPETWLEPLRGPLWGYRRRARLGARYVPKKGRVRWWAFANALHPTLQPSTAARCSARRSTRSYRPCRCC